MFGPETGDVSERVERGRPIQIDVCHKVVPGNGREVREIIGAEQTTFLGRGCKEEDGPSCAHVCDGVASIIMATLTALSRAPL